MNKIACNKRMVFLIATFFLLLGISCYAFLYPNKFHFVNLAGWHIEFYKIDIQSVFILTIVYSLTSYCHIIFMTLYSLLITDRVTYKSVVKWSIFWGVMDSVFEIMQLKEKSENSLSSNYWILNKVNHYLETGHFDIWDLFVIWLGVVSLIIFWRVFCQKNVKKAGGG